MKKVFLASILWLSIPSFSHAAGDLQTMITSFTSFLDDTVLVFLMGVAFLFFIFNTARFFIIESANEEGRDKAKALAIYGVSAFVFIAIFSGIINLLSTGIGLENESLPTPDYCPVTGC